MTTYAPRMDYEAGNMQRWETNLSFTVLYAPFERVARIAGSLVRYRDGSVGETEGEVRPACWKPVRQRGNSASVGGFSKVGMVCRRRMDISFGSATAPRD